MNGNGPHWVPHIWGTEGIAWRTDQWSPEGEFPSYGDVWDDANAGKTMGRGHSMMLGAGLYLERIGELAPGSMWQAYIDENDMRETWGKLTEYCISKKPNIKLIWNDADTQKNGLMSEGVVVGQTWDGPPMSLKTAGEPVMYRAPIEGAMAWVDGMTIPIGAENIDAVYAFIDHCYQAEPAGRAIDTHGYNSPVIGAEQYANADYAKNFADAYPGDALGQPQPLASGDALVRGHPRRVRQPLPRRLTRPWGIGHTGRCPFGRWHEPCSSNHTNNESGAGGWQVA